MLKVLNGSVLFILLFLSVIIMIGGCGSDSNTVIYNPTSTPAETPHQTTPTVTPTLSQTVIVTGQIKDEAGNPIPNAYVIYYDLTTGQTYAVTADENGIYRFENIPPGPGRIEMWRSKSDHDNSPGNPTGAVNIITVTGINTVNLTAGQVDPTPTPGTATPVTTVTPGSSPTQTQPVGNCIIDGIVQESFGGGAPVAGATVTIAETGQTAYTDSNGYFFFNVFPGIYTVTVNKSTRAQTKAQSVQAVAYQKTTLTLIELHAVSNSWSNTAPTISGSADIISGNVNINATGTYNVKGISLYIGNLGTVFRSSGGSSLVTTLDPNIFAPGKGYIYITAIDVNNNMTVLMINHALPDKISTSLPKPVNLSTDACTMGENAYQYKSRIKNLKERGKLPQDFNGDIIKLKNGKTIDISALPPDTYCYISLFYNRISDALSYKIYRSTSQAGPYTPVGFIINKPYFYSNMDYYDTDPSAVKPGQTLYYKVSACNATGEGPLSDASQGVKVLDVFRVYLQSPSNNSTVTTANPTFTWKYDNVGDERYLRFILYKGNDNKYIDYAKNFSGDIHSYIYDGPPLNSNNVYEWNLFAEAYSSDGYSTSFTGCQDFYYDNDGQNDYNSASNGRFQFTTYIR